MRYTVCAFIFIFMLGVGIYCDRVVNMPDETTSNTATEQTEALSDETEEDVEDVTILGTIVLDPGHGGDDPGKVGINLALEKDLNLIIANKVADMLTEKGYEVVMTREEDTGVGGESNLSNVEDLADRVELINETNPILCVSIHQNSYEVEEIKGAQVFYYTNSIEGEILAQCVQDALLEIDTDNTRQIKGNDTYYLLCRTQVPTIIVECGFLSNMEEANKLIDDTYQTEIANAIVKGVEAYLQE